MCPETKQPLKRSRGRSSGRSRRSGTIRGRLLSHLEAVISPQNSRTPYFSQPGFHHVYLDTNADGMHAWTRARALCIHVRGKLHGRRIIYRLVFVFAPNRRRYRFDKPSFRKRVRYPDVFGMVRSTRGHADGRESEIERETAGRIYMYAIYTSYAHEDTLYRRPWLRLSSSRSVSASSFVFSPK